MHFKGNKPKNSITFRVRAGRDENRDRKLSKSEITHGFKIEMISFDTAEIHAQRTSAPQEPLLPTKSDPQLEHYEVGGTFHWKLIGLGADQKPIRWIIWDTDGFNERLQEGIGLNANRTLQASDTNDAMIQYYCDRNDDNKPNGEEENRIREFRIQHIKTYNLDVQFSNQIPGGVTA